MPKIVAVKGGFKVSHTTREVWGVDDNNGPELASDGSPRVLDAATKGRKEFESLEDTVRALMEHLENYCDFPSGAGEEKLSRRIYAALGDTTPCCATHAEFGGNCK